MSDTISELTTRTFPPRVVYADDGAMCFVYDRKAHVQYVCRCVRDAVRAALSIWGRA